MSVKTILSPSLAIFCMEMQEAILEGFRLDGDNPANMWGICFESVMVKDDTVEDYVSVQKIGEKLPSVIPVKKMGRPVGKGKL